MARYGCTITVAAGKIPSSQSNFSWVATEDNFPTAAIDGGFFGMRLNGTGTAMFDRLSQQLKVATPSDIRKWHIERAQDQGFIYHQFVKLKRP